VQFLRWVASRERSRFVSEALAVRLEERDAALVRARDIANRDMDVAEIEKELGGLRRPDGGTMEVIPERGEIWWVTLDPTLGAEIPRTRPCIVMSVKALNERRRTVIAVPLSGLPKAAPPVLIPVWFGGQPDVAVSDQIRALAKERLSSRLGAVTMEEMAALEDALRQIMRPG
jgi:mRNA interferase MazF